MAEYKIEDVPLRGKLESTSFKYPFGKMKVGQSFAFDICDYQLISSAASWYGKRNKIKFSIRKQEDGSYRCGRVK
jgi:hypothetical protein